MKYRSIDDITEEYLRNHPDEIDAFIEECETEGDTDTLKDLMQIVNRIRFEETKDK